MNDIDLDIGWRRTLYIGAALAVLATAIMLIFIIPQLIDQPGIKHGPEWVLTGIHFLIAAVLFAAGFKNKREGRLIRILLFSSGILAIFLSILLLLSISDVSDREILRRAVMICSADDIIIGVIALRSSILF